MRPLLYTQPYAETQTQTTGSRLTREPGHTWLAPP
jgi:hypothetical protein